MKKKTVNKRRRPKKRKAGPVDLFLGRYGIGVFFALSIIYLELLIAINKTEPVRAAGIIYSVSFAIAYGGIIYFAVKMLPLLPGKILAFATSFFISFLFASQVVYYNLFTTYFTVFSASKGTQVMEFLDDIFYMIRTNIHWIILIFLPFISLFFIHSRLFLRREKREIKYYLRNLIVFFAALAVFVSSILAINLGAKGRNSPYNMYYNSFVPNISVSALGLMTTMRLDLKRTVFGFEGNMPMPDISAPPDPTPVPEKTPGENTSEEESLTPEIEYGYNVMDIDFRNLAENESDPVLENMHLYFAGRNPSRQNEYTGMFEGYNLIFLTAEAYSHLAIDPEVTPTLYKMTHEGFNFTNFYTPLWGVSTSDGEYVATTGLIPKTGVWSMYLSGFNHMPFTMGNQLRLLDYDTRAYHNHTYNYYRRDVSHPNLGYIYKGIGNGLVLENDLWPNSDLEMMEATVDEYIKNQPFHAYYMTVSGHLRYNFVGNHMAMKNRHYVEDLPYNEAGRAYMATQIELDRALEYLLMRLEEEGIADNTLIVMSSDHYPYGLSKSDLNNLAGEELDQNFEIHRNSLIIYAKGMTPETIDIYCSSLDIIPTISNLLGLEYDSRLLMGNDIFSEHEPLVIFGNKSFITQKGRYNAVTDRFIPHEGYEYDSEYAERTGDIVDRKFYYSAMILDKDYYSIVVPER